jgi:hypothetical protein
VAELSKDGFALASRLLDDVRAQGQAARRRRSKELFEQLRIGGFVLDAGATTAS